MGFESLDETLTSREIGSSPSLINKKTITELDSLAAEISKATGNPDHFLVNRYRIMTDEWAAVTAYRDLREACKRTYVKDKAAYFGKMYQLRQKEERDETKK